MFHLHISFPAELTAWGEGGPSLHVPQLFQHPDAFGDNQPLTGVASSEELPESEETVLKLRGKDNSINGSACAEARNNCNFQEGQLTTRPGVVGHRNGDKRVKGSPLGIVTIATINDSH